MLASRLSLLAVGLLASSLVPSGSSRQPGNLIWHPAAPAPLEIWARWDAEWYLLIADEGYDVGDDVAAWGWPRQRDAAAGFFPLYPWLIRILEPVFGLVGAGVVVSNVALLAVGLLAVRTLELEVGDASGRMAGVAAFAVLLAWPMSLFLSAVYAESVFLALALATYISLRQGKFGMAALWGGLAALARPFGVLLALPIVIEWWQGWRGGGCRPYHALATLGPVAGLSAFGWICWRTFGDPLAFVARQERWRGSLSGPWAAFVRWWQSGPTAHGSHGSILELVLALGVLALLPVAIRRLRPSASAYLLVVVVIALSSTLWSFGRLMLGAFPLVILAGLSWHDGRRLSLVAGASFGTALSGLLMALYAAWWWAG